MFSVGLTVTVLSVHVMCVYVHMCVCMYVCMYIEFSDVLYTVELGYMDVKGTEYFVSL
jgi:hypothetical protein